MTDWQKELKLYEKERSSMSKKELELKQQLLSNKQQQINNYQQAIQKQIAEEDKKSSQTLINDINDYVKNRQLHDFPLRKLLVSSLDHLQKENHYDFIMQDGDHNPSYVDVELSLFKTLPNLKTVWSHDYYLRGALEPTFIKNKNMWLKNFPFKEEAYRAGFHIGLI